jgi:GNAT superfamily N-acetyltransferase
MSIDIRSLTPVEVDYATASRHFWDRFHAFRRVRHMETRPDDPFRPDDIVEGQLKKGDPFSEQRIFALMTDDQMISSFGAGRIKPGAPGYETNQHLLWGGAEVHPDFRRQGVGTAWLPVALKLMDEFGSTVLSTGTEEESGHAFLRLVGFEAKSEFAENRLDFNEVDWDMVRQWVEKGERDNPNTTLTLYPDRVPEEVWPEYAPQISALLNTMPFDDLDHGEIVVTPEMMKVDYEKLDLMKGVRHTIITREPDGHMSGMTDVGWAPFRETFISQRFTGVNPKDRGRGIGKWIKAAMLEYVRKTHPQARWMTTGNAESNAPMLAINRRLGFKQYRANTGYQISRDKLAEFVAGL